MYALRIILKSVADVHHDPEVIRPELVENGLFNKVIVKFGKSETVYLGRILHVN